MPSEKWRRAQLLEEARDALAFGDWETVRAKSRSILDLDPNNKEAANFLGKADQGSRSERENRFRPSLHLKLLEWLWKDQPGGTQRLSAAVGFSTKLPAGWRISEDVVKHLPLVYGYGYIFDRKEAFPLADDSLVSRFEDGKRACLKQPYS